LPPAWTLWIAGANVVIKESLFHYKSRVGRRTGSSAILANAWDHRSDAICSLAVLIGLAIARYAGPQYTWADEAAALVVVVAIVWAGLRMLGQTTSELLDPQADPEIVEQVRKLAESVPGVRGVEKLWVRKTGIEYLVDIHIQVDARMTVEEGHRVGHLVKNQLVRQVATVRDVLVHLEPFPHVHGSPPNENQASFHIST
jgi:cation diffusion facilitator family transporter